MLGNTKTYSQTLALSVHLNLDFFSSFISTYKNHITYKSLRANICTYMHIQMCVYTNMVSLPACFIYMQLLP